MGRWSALAFLSVRRARRYRIFGWAYVVMLVTFIVLKGKNYYLAPVYPILFAAGAIAFERITTRPAQEAEAGGRSGRRSTSTGTINERTTQTAEVGHLESAAAPDFRWLNLPSAPTSCSWCRWVYVALSSFWSARHSHLFRCPFFSPETYIRYQQTLGFEPPKAENQNTGPLPQHFADEFGWEEMTRR